MNKNLYSITKNDLYDLFSRLARENMVFVPYEYKERFISGKFDPAKETKIQLGGIRQTQPFKSFINPTREKIFGNDDQDLRPVIVAGVKQCDLNSLILQDYVFLKGDCEDPFYASRRNNTLIISSDCTSAKETCFCLAMGGRPYPAKDFDINLSPLDALAPADPALKGQGKERGSASTLSDSRRVDDFFLVEIGTDKGNAIIDGYKTFFKNARSSDINIRDKIRSDVSGQINVFIKKRGTPAAKEVKGTVKKQYNNISMWQDFSSTCVECGACNLACPTCHCFLLFDEKSRMKIARGRVWDACLYKTFARVAGGANPRKHLYERLRNRFDKKFAFFPEVLDYTACTGCGRCIEACPGNIDLREVLKGLVSGAWNKPPHI